MNDEQIKHVANRFLMWRLPENFYPDGGISFKPIGNKGTIHEFKREPVGTNLFDAVQAEAMVRYMIDGMPSSVPAQPEVKPAPFEWTMAECAAQELWEKTGLLLNYDHKRIVQRNHEFLMGQAELQHESELERVRQERDESDREHDKEIRNWQDAIYKLCCKEAVAAGKSDSEIDGGFSDGDELEYSLTEIQQAFSCIKERAESQLSTMREALGPDAAGRSFEDLLRQVASVLHESGGGPLADCLSLKAEALASLNGKGE